MKYPIRTLVDDSYDQNGEHSGMETECLCNYDIMSISVDRVAGVLVCEDCKFKQELPKFYDQDLADDDLINYWQLI